MRRLALAALASVALLAGPATAEIFKCVDASGRVIFVNDPKACPDAEPYDLKGNVSRTPSAASRAREEKPASDAAMSPAQRLEWALLDERNIYPGWEIVNETPEDASQDVDLVEWGVVAKRARHYTRKSDGASQVCSVELWAFESEARARLAGQNFAFPDWRIDRQGDMLVMLHAVTLRGELAERTIFSDCEKLGNIVRTRAAKFTER
ncbi:MAG: DUF4124 domain-containing protein [Deltaproteobacteria bacterium]|jgi:hypothetical protein|nr:DUF4124 domain-containing protein [Deltaproteobacteria bacterium]